MAEYLKPDPSTCGVEAVVAQSVDCRAIGNTLLKYGKASCVHFFLFRVNVGVFVDKVAQMNKSTRPFVLLKGGFNNEWLPLAPGVVSETTWFPYFSPTSSDPVPRILVTIMVILFATPFGDYGPGRCGV